MTATPETPADTASRLALIRGRADAATPGHWGTDYDGKGTYVIHSRLRTTPKEGMASDGVVASLVGQHGDQQTYANARFTAHARDDVPFLLDRVTELEQHAGELHHLRQESLLLRSLAQEFRIPLTNSVGGYGEVVVRRWTLAEDRWQVTDGAAKDPKVWIDGEWLPITDVGLEKAHPYTLDEALKTAHQVAEYEGATFEAWVKATKDAYEYQCPQCMRWAFWENGRGTQHGDEVDEFWCQVCGAESRASLCERRPAKGGVK
ncbi:hypothetical protein AB0454_22610 [Streptomyces sp. NPDC093509]|uniref:hypothetical protein n=1 Tax=Streptomyces sp. NPDC093509 TaxID=3154982 RepID=UPI0034506389